MKRGDKAVLLSIGLLLAASLSSQVFLCSEGARWAVIYLEGREWRRIDAAGPPQRIEVTTTEGHKSVIEVEGGRVRFLSSDCPDQICVHQGWLDHAGVSALCLPNRIEIRLEGVGKEEDAVDAFSF